MLLCRNRSCVAQRLGQRLHLMVPGQIEFSGDFLAISLECALDGSQLLRVSKGGRGAHSV